ncbi:histidinol phosphate phosphatase [Bradyrhizobium macuxiense]|uniref:D,D-heptose 1,7-bisphosphate phosphatase n=1 Tax=Bradyrhizobium macuxiense TaxID=1755647 RepID=A0A109JEZ6_9BRAD|nr:HAD-IIIA family hydrolase [Bradyrhizobium macuxiense]KWV47681.1 histidinol phosphate phosphatase [Bradyrhizobium macuxiense]
MAVPNGTSRYAHIEGRIYDRPTQAVILAGGRGTRMQPITLDRPKPMVPVLGRPFLEYQIEQLRDQGFERVLILLGYLPEVVQDHFGDGRDWGVHIEYSVTDPDQLTSSRVATARHMIDPCFLLLYCDNYWPMQMDRLWARFCEAGKPGLITVYSNKDGYSRGSALLDRDGHVGIFDRLRTTPGLQQVEISYAILTDLALALLPEQDTLLEEAIYTPLAQQGRLTSYSSDHRYYGVGSLDRLPATEAFMQRKPTLILDRDGVLNRKPPQAQYVRNWDEWTWCPGSLEALRILHDRGYRTIIASNQPGIGRGIMSEADLDIVHAHMKQEIAQVGGSIDAIYYCPHDWGDGCDCRKPKPGLLFQAQRDFHLDLTRTLFIGDDERDAAAAAAAGCPFRRVTDACSLLDLTRQLLEQKAPPQYA